MRRRIREQARSHMICGVLGIVGAHTPTVGVSLLAKALGQATTMLNAPPYSRASSLPHDLWRTRNRGCPHPPCGSEPAREGVGSGDYDVECAAVFASKLAPT